ncbi:MAG: CRISPR-associated CARF protein Csa3 [Nanoarchaeota archaeon]
MTKIIISTLYDKEPTLVAATKLGADQLYIVVDDPVNDTQQTAMAIIKESLEKVVKIYTIEAHPYDIVGTARKIVALLENFSEDDHVTVNITSGRKTQSLGLLYGAYARARYVNRIIYISEEEHRVIDLPKLSFNLTESQIQLLEQIEKRSHSSLSDLAEKSGMSRSMLYRNIKNLEDHGFIMVDKQSRYLLTDAGKIARL